jgi:molybdenum cofactor cytidylyltransferase
VIAALVLAAGLGTRMGASKPLLDIDGVPALARVLATIDAARLAPVVVVLGRDADLVASRVELSRHVVVTNSRPEMGLSSSLALGLAAVPSTSPGVLIFHADMPFVQRATVLAVAALVDAGARLAAPCHGETRGFPVFVCREWFEPLQATLSGDSGARRFIERHRDALRLAAVDDPGCIRDLDRPEDLVPSGEEMRWTTFA